MIRFIDIRNQGTGERFAFFNTKDGTFLKFDHAQAWENLGDFSVDYDYEEPCNDKWFKELCALCPDWANDCEDDDLEGWGFDADLEKRSE